MAVKVCVVLCSIVLIIKEGDCPLVTLNLLLKLDALAGSKKIKLFSIIYLQGKEPFLEPSFD